MSIEQVLRKIVEDLEYAVNDEDGEIIESGVNALIHALLNSEEISIGLHTQLSCGCKGPCAGHPAIKED